LPAYYGINHQIHNRINAAAANPVLTATYLQMNARIQSLRFRSNFNQDKWDTAVREHSAMLAALEARDGAQLRALLEQHLQNKLETVLDDLRMQLSA
jgi:DNA-binding GntR family transcriptional regulator